MDLRKADLQVERNTTARMRYLDIARGIAMLAIIAGHFGIVSANRIVYTFHVPLFLLLAGFFFKERESETWYSFFLRYFRQLIIPYLIGCVGICLATGFWFPVQGLTQEIPGRLMYIVKAAIWGAGTAHVEPIEIHQIGALWFLPALFIGFMTLRLGLLLKKPLLVTILASLFALVSSQFFWLPLSIQPGLLASFFLFLGMWVRSVHIDLFIKPDIKYVLAAFAIWALCILFNVSINIVDMSLAYGGVCILGALAGSYSIIFISRVIELYAPKLLSSFLSYFGQITLSILVFHAIADFTIPWWMFYDLLTDLGLSMRIQHVIILIVNILLPLLCVQLLKFVKPLRRLLIPRDPVPFATNE